MRDTFFPFVFVYIKRYRWAFLGLFFLASLTGLYGTLISYLIKVVIDSLVVLGATASPDALVKASVGPAIFFVLNYEIHDLLWRSVEYINLKTAPKIKNNIIEALFTYIHQHSLRFFQENFSGAISNNITVLVDNVEKVLHNSLLFVITTAVQLGVALFAMYSVHSIFAIGLLAWVGGFLVIRFLFAARARNLSHHYAHSQSMVSGKLVDSFQGINLSRLFERREYETQYLQKYLVQMQDKFVLKESFLLIISLCQGLSISVLISFMLFFLIRLRAQNLVSIGDFALILGLVLTVTRNMWTLTKHIDTINDAIGKCNQSLQTFLLPLDIKETPNLEALVVRQGQIDFKEVQFHYPGAEPLFQNQTLRILPGQRVGLVGCSGSGKSTFVNLILRLFELNSGSILIDGQNIQEVTQASLRQNIGVIPQDPTLFHRSVMENIRYGNLEASDEDVIEAAKKAQAHEFIIKLALGYETLLGENGLTLSGGQRQRLSIARAILKNAPILILDEATSQLDSVTENQIKASFWEFMEGKTTLVIAHRLSTLLHMDRIIVFDQGQIAQDGAHGALLSNKGLYKALWDAQTGDTLPAVISARTQEIGVVALDYE